MNVRRWSIAILFAVTMWGLVPETSQAQLFGRRGVGVGYGYGNGYGSGWGYGYPSYYGGWGTGMGYGYGSRYAYPTYYNNTYFTTPSVVSGQPISNGTTSTYQSFYPPTVNGVAGQTSDPCCCSGPGTTQMANVNQSGGTLVVNVPENAQLFWNGTTPMVGTGTSRRFTLQSYSAPQSVEARWTGPDGKTVTQTREVVGRPNETVTIDFNTNGVNGANDGRTNQTTPTNPSLNDARPTGGRPN